MKKIGFFIGFLLLTYSVFGQQFLWSTVRRENVRNVSMNNVTREVLEFYDQYRFYYDFTGFSKDRFIEMFDYGFEGWEWLYEIEEPTVFALRSNSGRGSVVLVMCISKNNVNTLIFTNTSELGSDWIMTHSGSNRDQFSRWFRTLLN